MYSTASLVLPYAFTGTWGWLSEIGTLDGTPYVAQELENTILSTPVATIAARRLKLPQTLLR
jgi:hypothetical protein